MRLDIQFAENSQTFNSAFGEVIKVGVEDNTQMYVLVTEDGKEIPAVLVDELTTFDATANDIRIGKTAATDSGITVGEKVIPGYLAHEGVKLIRPNSSFEIKFTKYDQYDYTLLECMICDFNTDLIDSVSTNKVVIGDNVYDVKSTVVISTVAKNHSEQSIDLGIINDTSEMKILRYFTYKEIY